MPLRPRLSRCLPRSLREGDVCGCSARDSRALGSGPPEAGPRSRPEVEWGLITRFPAGNGADAPLDPAGSQRTSELAHSTPTGSPGPGHWPVIPPQTRPAQPTRGRVGANHPIPRRKRGVCPHSTPRGRPRRANPSQVGAYHPLPRRKRGVCPHSTPAGGRVIPARIRQGQPGAPCEQPRYRVKVFLRSAQNRWITPSRRAESPALT